MKWRSLYDQQLPVLRQGNNAKVVSSKGRGAEEQRGRGEGTWYLNSPLHPCTPAQEPAST
ncbi:hypothetical protein COO91_09665 (plasmid) [Nostoc flagelliforme CCNUN1]|uniref:Uncharacterized protein n=1 Tax=Nostoc flagelliforme CCNUN1 TaxID=2038116 RepID=A0A2K8T717_9NOSO|nr:hypothetical protein COO91_09665 [Nostoc flagelliforme CCNUN1]